MKDRLTLKGLSENLQNIVKKVQDIQRSHENKINEITSKMIDWKNAYKELNHQMYQIELDILNNQNITECRVCHLKVTEKTAKIWNGITVDRDYRTFEIRDKSYEGCMPPCPICPECEKEGEIAIYKMLFEKDDE